MKKQSKPKTHKFAVTSLTGGKARKGDQVDDVFSLFDRNGDGSISTTDLKNAMKALGKKTSESELKYIIEELDTTGSGMVSKYEF